MDRLVDGSPKSPRDHFSRVCATPLVLCCAAERPLDLIGRYFALKLGKYNSKYQQRLFGTSSGSGYDAFLGGNPHQTRMIARSGRCRKMKSIKSNQIKSNRSSFRPGYTTHIIRVSGRVSCVVCRPKLPHTTLRGAERYETSRVIPDSIIQQAKSRDIRGNRAWFFLSIPEFQNPVTVSNPVAINFNRQSSLLANRHINTQTLATWHQYQRAESLLLACLQPNQTPLPRTRIPATHARWRSGTVNYREGICEVTGSKHWILYRSYSRTHEI
jgi:hypothetical protein